MMSLYNKVAKGLVLRSKQDSECLFDGTKSG